MRKLASIRRVMSISPIQNADAIERAQVDGWGVVVKKGEFSPGDLCVYFEVDSLLPEEPRYEFLRKGCYTSKSQNGPGFRLKTIKLRGTLSQGLVLPLKDFPELEGLEEGTDVTDLLNVKKWEPIIPANLAGEIKGNFPSFIPKTEQERIQNLHDRSSEYYIKYGTGPYEVTLKLHGTSCTIYRHDGEFGVCSRNLDLKETEGNVYWQVARMYDIENKMIKHGLDNIAIQGEIMGPGINGNREKLDKFTLFVFDIYDIAKGKYLTNDFRTFISDGLEIEHVPIIEEYYSLGVKSLEELLEWADNIPSINHDVAEGMVFKNQWDTSISFKVISNKFLLSEK